MSATERLRALLDERGVEWTYADGTVSFNDGNRWFHAWAYNDGAMCVSMGYLTPEQAIAATLGGGTLAADDVRDAIERHSDASGGNGRDFHSGAYEAIADELNSTLGTGTCEVIMSEPDGKMWVYCHEFSCDCGQRNYFTTSSKPPKYCPNCGRKVVAHDHHGTR